MHVRAATVHGGSSAAPRTSAPETGVAAPRLRARRRARPRRRGAARVTRVTVDPARSLGTLSPHVFGGFVEHLGRCIYGGVYDEGSPLSDERGFRRDVLDLLGQLHV